MLTAYRCRTRFLSFGRRTATVGTPTSLRVSRSKVLLSDLAAFQPMSTAAFASEPLSRARFELTRRLIRLLIFWFRCSCGDSTIAWLHAFTSATKPEMLMIRCCVPSRSAGATRWSRQGTRLNRAVMSGTSTFKETTKRYSSTCNSLPEGAPMFDRLFTTPRIDPLVSDEALIAAMLKFESALATVQADLGLIPPTAARVIDQCCSGQSFDVDGLCRSAERDGNPAIPLVKALGKRVAAIDADAARYVHLGATSQDVIDTALMLCTKKALDVLVADVVGREERLIGLIERHRRTFMPGRTLLQHARPVSFGLKAAGWLDGIFRCRKMLQQGAAESLVVQFGGAV